MQLPRMIRIRQTLKGPSLPDPAAEVHRQLQTLQLECDVRPGQTVAITAGSRGISNIAAILRAIVEHFRSLRAEPFLVPAMGSHGGATAEGQTEVLRRYGITEQTVGAPIRSTMQTVVVAHTPDGIPIHFDQLAYQADWVFLCNRVKPHTGLTGRVESGLLKMLLIGLGKHAGAQIYHRAFVDRGFEQIVQSVWQAVVQKCRVLGGLAIVENGRKETAMVEAIRPEDFLARESELLNLARQWMARLPFREVDLLIIDEIGKDISGTGMDTNVVGRKYAYHASTEQDDAHVKRIFVRGLSAKTAGNANGLGMADVTNRRTLQAVDWHATTVNALTANRPPSAAAPIAFDTDRQCIEAMLKCVGLVEPPQARVIHIANTQRLEELLVSEAYQTQLQRREDLAVLEGPHEMQFDQHDNLRPVFSDSAP